MASLDVYMNEYYVGIFTKKSSGAHSFQYSLIFFLPFIFILLNNNDSFINNLY